MMVSAAASTFAIGAALAVYPADVFEDPPERLRADGIIVLDSTAYIHGTLHWTKYMTDLLYDIYKATGQRCLAVALGGMSFAGSVAKSYEYLLELITKVCIAPKFMVWVALGNDVYPPHVNMQSYEAPLRAALKQFLIKAMVYCPEHRFVFGGSSDVWQYRNHFPEESCVEYDRICSMVTRYIHSQRGVYPGIGAITGSSMLKGVVLVDRIGHLGEESMTQLPVFFRMLAKWGMAGHSGRRSRL